MDPVVPLVFLRGTANPWGVRGPRASPWMRHGAPALRPVSALSAGHWSGRDVAGACGCTAEGAARCGGGGARSARGAVAGRSAAGAHDQGPARASSSGQNCHFEAVFSARRLSLRRRSGPSGRGAGAEWPWRWKNWSVSGARRGSGALVPLLGAPAGAALRARIRAAPSAAVGARRSWAEFLTFHYAPPGGALEPLSAQAKEELAAAMAGGAAAWPPAGLAVRRREGDEPGDQGLTDSRGPKRGSYGDQYQSGTFEGGVLEGESELSLHRGEETQVSAFTPEVPALLRTPAHRPLGPSSCEGQGSAPRVRDPPRAGILTTQSRAQPTQPHYA